MNQRKRIVEKLEKTKKKRMDKTQRSCSLELVKKRDLTSCQWSVSGCALDDVYNHKTYKKTSLHLSAFGILALGDQR